jgi:enamine deaminase RidA (YjgF/YER057c/UK114 family)
MAAIEFVNPPDIRAPGGKYSHTALVAGPARWLYISGQIGADQDGKVADDGAAQIAQTLANLKAALAHHGMGPQDIVKLTVFLTTESLIPLYRAARDQALPGILPASTLLIVAGLADPRYLVEIEAVAAAA